MRIGKLWRFFGSKVGFAILLTQTVLTILFLNSYSKYHGSEGCLSCHADKKRIEELGYPQFYVTREQVQKETKCLGSECRDCHLGNGGARDADSAHKGMLRPILIDWKTEIIPRKDILPELLPTGDDRMRAMLPKIEFRGKLTANPEVATILYHDRNRETFGYDPEIAKKTCGRSNCHPQEVRQFNHTIMGSNLRQRTMRTWMEPYGPHNCGPSFADTKADGKADGDRFSFENTRKIAEDLNLPFTQGQAIIKQRFCNICHASCLDCHYLPSKEEGVHSFTKTPPSLNCLGGGRNTLICHTGAMDRRRGDGYLNREFSQPPDLPEDSHIQHKIECINCHLLGPKGMGDIERKATCGDCHIEIEDALKESDHKDLSCSSCHISILGGYQLTTWGPGKVGGSPSPFKKYSLYYGIFEPPILIKDQKGRWIPVKVWPNTVGNIKTPVEARKEIQFRWPKGETRDSYILLGTFDGLPGSNHLAWLQIEEAGHPLRKSRSCKSCHASKVQEAKAKWQFDDTQGALPFRGGHRVIADETGLRIVGLRNTSEIRLLPNSRLSDFASWYYLRDIWKIPGDFSIPESDKERYEGFLAESKRQVEILKRIDRVLKEKEGKGLDVKRLRKDWRRAKSISAHNPQGAKEPIERLLEDIN